VDDDPTTLMLIRTIVGRGGFSLETATDGAQALERLRQSGAPGFDAVLTDYMMPVMNGLELLEQIRMLDPTLATIINTSDSERTTLSASLKGGVCDFLEKPCNPKVVLGAMERAVGLTRRQRSLHSAERRLADVCSIQQRLAPNLSDRTVRPGELECELTTRICPIHEAGGDFVSVFHPAPGSVQLVLGDVSGHGLLEGFIAAYFQGMVKGMQTVGVEQLRIAEACNRFLLVEWLGKGVEEVSSSLSAIFLDLDLVGRKLKILNCGCPALHCHAPGRPPEALAGQSCPLGWFETLSPGMATVQLEDTGSCCVWSDGLLDQAKRLDLTPHAVAARLLLTPPAELAAFRHVSNFADDVLVARFRWFPSGGEQPDDALPLYHEALPGDSGPTIDAVQARFQRNLLHAMPELPSSCLTSILLCVREALINALKHGCAGLRDAVAHLTAILHPRQRRLEITVSDSGPGRPQVMNTPAGLPVLSSETGHVSLGLEMIHFLTVATRQARNGAELTMEFDLAAA
jgi:CheY-like chemotaxis protein/anti-sigma regulatory factor (Ser/Thr protein kinase)